ncbi:hypothetical protein AMURIS_02576 [Acetatifactor muris]|jgi:hypothetical protein|uniref:Uncharacterized protein n=1 Tax=Acetatifactor muris TaxID=879566 RepID=A0A2K4ZHB5_9FIRM|nr:hypothetical protein AMURIS_02576 [Acetatifactor muris]
MRDREAGNMESRENRKDRIKIDTHEERKLRKWKN